jgi:hypothetical protein
MLYWYADSWFEDFYVENDVLRLNTKQREVFGFPIGYFEVYRFDVKSGRMLVHHTNWPTATICIITMVIVLASVGVGWAIRRLKRRVDP